MDDLFWTALRVGGVGVGGPLGRPLGGLLEVSWRSLGGLLEASWGPLGASWGLLGASRGPLGEVEQVDMQNERFASTKQHFLRSHEAGESAK